VIAAELRAAIERAAAYAITDEPTDMGQRARCFVAGLSGALQIADPALSDVLWGILDGARIDAAIAQAEASAQ
jgi:hypothetical protein